jgi:hypothetical protein
MAGSVGAGEGLKEARLLDVLVIYDGYKGRVAWQLRVIVPGTCRWRLQVCRWVRGGIGWRW